MKTILVTRLTPSQLADWQQLWDTSTTAHFYNSPVWLNVCRSCFPHQKVQIAMVTHDQQLLALMLVVQRPQYGVTAYTYPGTIYTDKASLLVSDSHPEAASYLLESLSTRGNLYLTEIEAHHLAWVASLTHWRVSEQPLSLSRYLPLSDDYLHTLSANALKKFMTISKKHQHHLSFSLHYPAQIHHLNQVEALELKSTKRSRHMALFDSSQATLLYQTVIKAFPAYGAIAFLRYDQRLIAADIGFVYKQTFSGTYTVYDPEFKRLSPGKLIKYFLAHDLAQRKFKCYDLSRGDAPYKQAITPFATPHYDVYYSNNPFIRTYWEVINRLKSVIVHQPQLYDMVRLTTHQLRKAMRTVPCL